MQESYSARCDQGRWGSDKSCHSFCHPWELFIFGIKGIQRIASLVIPPLVQLVGCRRLNAVDFSCQERAPLVTCNCLLSRFGAYFILNKRRWGKPRLGTWTTIGSRRWYGPQAGAGQFLNPSVDSHLRGFQIRRNLIFEAVRKVEKGWPTFTLSISTGR